MKRTQASLDRFDLDTWMTPIWRGRTAYHESVMFIGDEGRAPLLYDPARIVSVRSQDLRTEYEPGRDYECRDGFLLRPAGSRMTAIPESLYYSKNSASAIELVTRRGGVPTQTYFSEAIYHYQVFVTYTHAPARRLPVPADESAVFAPLLEKLTRGGDVTLVFFGDSITNGASASGRTGEAPGTPIWPQMFTFALAKRFGYTVRFVQPGLPSTLRVPKEPVVFGGRGTITYVNPSVGGWSARHGVERYDEYVRPFLDRYGCDFFLYGFGMNNGRNDEATERALVRQVTDRVLAQTPTASLLLLATMVPNPAAINGWYGNQARFEPMLYELAAEYRAAGAACAVAPMTSMSRALLERKRFCDYTGNNINHPNDYMARLYAQTVLATVAGIR